VPGGEHVASEDRVTEIGAPEQIDRADHPVAVAVGLGVLLVLLLVGVVAFGLSLSSDEEPDAVTQVVLPSMSGRGLADAQTELERLGLIVDVEYASNEIVAVDVVIDQQPIAGTRIEVGEQVRLRVSDGPAGIDVPALSGLQGGEAVKLLATIGLVGSIENVFDEAIRPGEVVGSVPAADARAAPGSTVVVRVSQGPAPRTVPEVAGRTLGEASVELARADLAVGEVTEQYAPDQTPGVVVSSDPAAGAQVPRDQPVGLVVTSVEPPVRVPDLVGLTSASAVSVAKDVGLTTSVRNQELSAGDTRIGLVISQSQVAGSRVASGTAVQVTVGIVAVPTTTTASTTTVPGATTTTVRR
jgi:serine/threonine-protein kinase